MGNRESQKPINVNSPDAVVVRAVTGALFFSFFNFSFSFYKGAGGAQP